MEIWLIRNGERSGPFHDYDVRRRIVGKELGPDSPAWHEGLPEWTTLSQIPLFEHEFRPPPEPAPAPEPASAPAASHPPPIPEKPKLARRFWARWLDIHCYIALWWFSLWLSGANIERIFSNEFVLLTQLVPWFVLEILLIHRFATTPGKFILGIRVLNVDGSYLTLAQSIRRGLRVYTIGIGLGWGLVCLICMAISGFTTRKIGTPLWDYFGGHRVTTRPLIPWRIVGTVLLFFLAIQLQVAVIAPYQMKQAAKQFPSLKEYIENNSYWHLPPRHQPSGK